MLLGFKRRFAPFVGEGSKTHTIRATRKIPPRVGEMCHCYVDPRQKTMRLLGRWPCVRVERVEFFPDASAGYGVSVFIEGVGLDHSQKDALAWRDGFRGHGEHGAFMEMMAFWAGRLPFHGQIIHWKWSPPKGGR
jgi:hypothetical protein